MTAARPDGDGLARPSADWPLVAVHALLLAGYALPWVQGSFGSRTALSAFDLGRFSASALGGASEPSTWTLLALAALPALAVDGLVLSAFGSRIGIGRRLGRPLALALSLPGLLLATAVLALTLRAAGGSPFVDGPAPGLYLAAAAGLVLLVALLPRRPFRRAARASRTARRGRASTCRSVRASWTPCRGVARPGTARSSRRRARAALASAVAEGPLAVLPENVILALS